MPPSPKGDGVLGVGGVFFDLNRHTDMTKTISRGRPNVRHERQTNKAAVGCRSMEGSGVILRTKSAREQARAQTGSHKRIDRFVRQTPHDGPANAPEPP
jgi:hypothetical protein